MRWFPFAAPARALACCLLFAGRALAAESTVPTGGEPLWRSDGAPPRLTIPAGNADAATFRVVAVDGPGFSHAWQVRTVHDASPAWAIELHAPLGRAVARGDAALVHFFARAIASGDETGAARLRVAVQRAGPDYAKSAETEFSIGPGWQEFFIPFAFAADFAPRAAEIALGFGYKQQAIEIGGCELLDFGDRVPVARLPRTRFSYAGREPGAAWRTDAFARIERIRQRELLIEVVDAEGRPVRGAAVRVVERRAAFEFGSALQFARLVSDTPENERYREKALTLFNAASAENDLKWPAWSGEWAGYSREQALQGLAWLHRRGFHVRGHVLVYPSWHSGGRLPAALGLLRGTAREREIPRLVLEHIADEAGATRGLIEEWDVINEPWDNHELMDLFGRDRMVDWFNAARAAAPEARLVLNDYSNHDATTDAPHVADFERNVRFLLGQHAPLGGLGLQAHLGSTPNSPANVLATLDRYWAEFHLPIRFTEFDVNTEDEELQADATRDFLILAFSHPAVIGFQLWGFWERAHWRPHGAMLRADFSEKPNAVAYRSLVEDRWRTRVDGVTDAAGRFALRGFHGDYTVAAEAGGARTEQEFSLVPADAPAVVRIQFTQRMPQ